MTNLRRGVFFVWGLSLLLAAPVLYTKVKKMKLTLFLLDYSKQDVFSKIIKDAILFIGVCNGLNTCSATKVIQQQPIYIKCVGLA